VLRSNTLIGALLLKRGDVDAMLCGTYGQHAAHLEARLQRHRPEARRAQLRRHERADAAAPHAVHLRHLRQRGPTAEQIAEMTLMAAEEVRRFGIAPKVALLSYSNFGSRKTASALKMREARRSSPSARRSWRWTARCTATPRCRKRSATRCSPTAVLTGEANLLIMPNLDAANIAFNLLKITGGDGITVGPILLGAAKPVHILTSTATVRRLVNMTALAVVDANHLVTVGISTGKTDRR
jgi:malate dehydrogenase (oxaloacetate-decarboxylating)(NADP+)